ncbi:MAG: response regulator transcription factor [Eubacteriales bacterium]|nr:response regulator transcription factor [Eubacteriales bacterium]
MYKILVIEDDSDINQLLVQILKKENYEPSSAFSGTEARLMMKMETYDLLLMDLMLPGLCGEELIREIRQESRVPILVLSAKGGIDDKVKAMELGADDYITKPFEQREVLVRIQAALRRANDFADTPKTEAAKESRAIRFQELELDPAGMTAEVAGQSLNLTAHEFQILQVMLENPKKVFSKESLYEAVWKSGYYGEDNTVSVHVSNIRKKIAALTPEEYIQTVWGIGYRLKPSK